MVLESVSLAVREMVSEGGRVGLGELVFDSDLVHESDGVSVFVYVAKYVSEREGERERDVDCVGLGSRVLVGVMVFEQVRVRDSV